MKRIITCIAIIFMYATATWSTIFIDGSFVINDTGDTKTQSGIALKVSSKINEDTNLFLKSLYTATTQYPNTVDETEMFQIQGIFGAEYCYHITQVPIFINVSAGIGISRTEIKPLHHSIRFKSAGENGISYGIWISPQWILNQYIAPFIEIGYSQSIYSTDLKDADIGGMQFFIGIRFTVWGKNKSLLEDYE